MKTSQQNITHANANQEQPDDQKYVMKLKMLALQNHNAKLPVSTLEKTKWAKRHVKKKAFKVSEIKKNVTNTASTATKKIN